MEKIYTIGYEAAAIDDFVATLRLMDVDLLLDVRELPISRRRGFAKVALKEALADAGIAYHHEKRLGSPKPIRDRLKKDWKYDIFFKDYGQHLEEHGSLMAALAKDLSGNVALMCFERNYKECHRRVVAAAFSELTGIQPIHLGVQSREQRKAYQAARMDTGQSVSAAQ